MGDRAVFGFRVGSGPVLYLYSHWGGESRHDDLQDALRAAADRIADGDTDYAIRIMVSQLISDDWHRETGYGLSVDSFASPDWDDVAVVELDPNGMGSLVVYDAGDLLAFGPDRSTEHERVPLSDVFAVAGVLG